jgi:hypothetical protein
MAEIEEQMRDAEEVKEPQLVIETDKSLDVEMTPTQLKSGGYVYIYDTQTYERSVCHRNNLRNALRKRRADGSLVFTTIKPKKLPQRGVLKCMLHPDKRKPAYDTWGFPVCMKANLTSPFQVRRHMQKRHKQEWEAIQEEVRREEREKERQLRESLITMSKKEEPPLYKKEPKGK